VLVTDRRDREAGIWLVDRGKLLASAWLER
jgi:hypothetical protein